VPMSAPPPPAVDDPGLAMADTPPAPEVTNTRIAGAEVIGTAVLMIVGPGSAILALNAIGGALGVSLAFGLALLAMAYTIGHVSGCHINPAVTLGFLASGKISTIQAAFYWAAQLVGAAIGGLVIYLISESGDLDRTGVFAANGWGDTIGSDFGLGSAAIVEIVFTALLVFVVLSTTTVGYPAGFGGIAAGLTLAMIHLVTIPVTNTSVNPARSFGAAIFAGGDHLGQLWAFFLFPLIGAVVGVACWMFVHAQKLQR
jgi:aquaporin Z